MSEEKVCAVEAEDTDILTKILSNSLNELNNAVKNPDTGDYEITRDGFTWTIPSFLIEPKNGIKTATHKFFDFVRLQFTKNGENKRIVFSIKDYMKFRDIKGIKYRRQAADEIVDAAKAFMRAEISGKGIQAGEGYIGMHVVQSANTEKRRRIEITLGDKFAELLGKAAKQKKAEIKMRYEYKHKVNPTAEEMLEDIYGYAEAIGVEVEWDEYGLLHLAGSRLCWHKRKEEMECALAYLEGFNDGRSAL